MPTHERIDNIKWIDALWNYLEATCPFEKEAMPLSVCTSWLSCLAKAARYFLSSNDDARAVYEDYLSHGEEWASRFLLDSDQELRPYFGLCNPLIMAALQEPLDIDAGVEYFRQLAKSIGLKDYEAIICYSHTSQRKHYVEYCTAVPHSDPIRGDSHARWIKIRDREDPSKKGLDLQYMSHGDPGAVFGPHDIDLDFRIDMLRKRGEQCFQLMGDSLHDRPIFTLVSRENPKRATFLVWEDAAPLFCTLDVASHTWCSDSGELKHCSCLTPQKVTLLNAPIPIFDCYKSTSDGQQQYNLDLFVRTGLDFRIPETTYNERIYNITRQSISPAAGAHWLSSSQPNSTRVWDYIQCYADAGPKLSLPEQVSTANGLGWEHSRALAADLISNIIMSKPPTDWFRSLELIGVIDEIYSRMHGATISLGVIEYPLLEAYWTALSYPPHSEAGRREETHIRGTGDMLAQMSREHSMACIAMMQTGVSNLDPSDLSQVMAMSSDNSIFVAASLLTDPHTKVRPQDIRHIIGNVGYPGLNLMIGPPGCLRISRPKNEVQTLSNTSRHSWTRQDKFGGSSLHLSFTGKRFPLVTTDEDTIDQDIFHLQSVVSLWDNRKHIADLDMLRLEKEGVSRISLNCLCAEIQQEPNGMEVMTLDSWRDILRPPRRRLAIVRAHQNLCARLAAVALCLQREGIRLQSLDRNRYAGNV